jgi:hypothetical protein
MLPDDHDVLNNLDERVFDSTAPPWKRRIAIAGRVAYLMYQAQLLFDIDEFVFDSELKGTFTQQVFFFKRLGHTALAMLDLRFSRTYQPDKSSPLIGTAQKEALAASLSTWSTDKDVKNIIVVSSVPLMFHTSFWAHIAHVADGERYPGHKDLAMDRNHLIDMFFQEPKVSLIVGGDVHMYSSISLCDAKGRRCIDEVITSGVTEGSTTSGEIKLWLFEFLVVNFNLGSIGDYRINFKESYVYKNYLRIMQDSSTGRIEYEGVFPNDISPRHFLLVHLFQFLPFAPRWLVTIAVLASALRYISIHV